MWWKNIGNKQVVLRFHILKLQIIKELLCIIIYLESMNLTSWPAQINFRSLMCRIFKAINFLLRKSQSALENCCHIVFQSDILNYLCLRKLIRFFFVLRNKWNNRQISVNLVARVFWQINFKVFVLSRAVSVTDWARMDQLRILFVA